jgi:putative transposase
VSDQLICGRRFRILTVVDDYTRECLALMADASFSGIHVGLELDRLMIERASRRWWSATTTASSPATPS